LIALLYIVSICAIQAQSIQNVLLASDHFDLASVGAARVRDYAWGQHMLGEYSKATNGRQDGRYGCAGEAASIQYKASICRGYPYGGLRIADDSTHLSRVNINVTTSVRSAYAEQKPGRCCTQGC
jgi:hypothetical protein